ncbi:hypothetical protein VNO78_27466 [Psophocarpus tetragonolobus]|uniref:Retrotransposon Copia-like N-terminal domain-containing protein n=1 Tax=Psophocarpus tetragonolobus TaxID=3891 RepID=A0AAN9XCA6_PSOTE
MMGDKKVHFWVLVCVFMAMENLCVHFGGKNYASWEFQFRMFVKGKGMWGHIDESSVAPTDNTALTTWETKDA